MLSRALHSCKTPAGVDKQPCTGNDAGSVLRVGTHQLLGKFHANIGGACRTSNVSSSVSKLRAINYYFRSLRSSCLASRCCALEAALIKSCSGIPGAGKNSCNGIPGAGKNSSSALKKSSACLGDTGALIITQLGEF